MESKPTALISVSDKTGVTEFARRLAELGFRLLSTGGTARALAAAGLVVTEVSDYTGFPEIMGGRVKTLHPRIHGGLLGRPGEDDAVMAEQDIPRIDLAVINLYPFEAVTSRPDCSLADAIENIDIGGPAMVRSAAKNFAAVGVVTSPDQYAMVLERLRRGSSRVSKDSSLSRRACREGPTPSFSLRSSRPRTRRSSAPCASLTMPWTDAVISWRRARASSRLRRPRPSRPDTMRSASWRARAAASWGPAHSLQVAPGVAVRRISRTSTWRGTVAVRSLSRSSSTWASTTLVRSSPVFWSTTRTSSPPDTAWAMSSRVTYLRAAGSFQGEKMQAHSKKRPTLYFIDFSHCSLCGLCVANCPTKTLKFSKEYEMAHECRWQGVVDLIRRIEETA